MKSSKNNYRFTAAVLGITVLLWIASAVTRADVVYNTLGASPWIDQQYGYAFSSIGDTATIVPTNQPLTTIAIQFGQASGATTPFTYTPDLTLNLYPNVADAVAQTGLIGSATVNNVTFHNDGVVDPNIGYNYEDDQLVTFDFTSQHIILPGTFVFTYYDTPTLDSNDSWNGADSFSVGLTSPPALVGTSPQDYFGIYSGTVIPLAGNNPEFDESPPAAGLNIEAEISVVPEPASLSLLGLGIPLLLRRRRRA